MDGGRPSIMTPKTLKKLREAFLMGYNDREACIYADIAPSTLYKYQEDNPEFSEQKEQYKLNPVLKARKVIFEALEKGNLKIAKWYLERRFKNEFGKDNDYQVSYKRESKPISKEEMEEVSRRIDAQIETFRNQSN